jgi:hypothetical protein
MYQYSSYEGYRGGQMRKVCSITQATIDHFYVGSIEQRSYQVIVGSAV